MLSILILIWKFLWRLKIFSISKKTRPNKTAAVHIGTGALRVYPHPRLHHAVRLG